MTDPSEMRRSQSGRGGFQIPNFSPNTADKAPLVPNGEKPVFHHQLTIMDEAKIRIEGDFRSGDP